MADSQWERLGVAGALARNYQQDSRTFLPLLAQFLQSSLPDATEVERKGGFFQKEKPITMVTVRLEEEVYRIYASGHGGLTGEHVKFCRGIVLKTETIPVGKWLEALSEHIESSAAKSEQTYFALKELLN